MTEPRQETIVLPDGRRLAYARYGDPCGVPAFYFHGWPGSRLEARLTDAIARQAGVRILSIDRPGYGGSDFAPGRTLLDWPDDVAALADALEFERFAVIGISGGGPYVAACAYRLVDRLRGACIVCGLGPVDRPSDLDGMLPFHRLGLGVARRAPSVAVPVLGLVAPLARRYAGKLVDRLARTTTTPDRQFFEDPDHRAAFEATFREGFRQGGRGPAWDVRLYARPWGFELENVETEVDLWHGGNDAVVPVAMGRAMARRLPRCRPRFPEREGHFSVVADRAEEIFRVLSMVS